MGAVIEFPQRDRVFYANYMGPGAIVIHLPPVYPLSPSQRAKQLRRWFNRRRPEPIVTVEDGATIVEFRD
jgi:hypothetical protein